MMRWTAGEEECNSSSQLRDATSAMAVLFHPNHVAIKEKVQGEIYHDAPTTLPETCSSREAASVPPCPSFWGSLWKFGRTAPDHDGQHVPSTASHVVSPVVSVHKTSTINSWKELPPSPLAGFTLTNSGLCDMMQKPPRVLSRSEIRDVITDLSVLEQKAKHEVDSQLITQMGSRAKCGMELIVSPCLFLCGLYLMLWKAPRVYKRAIPRESVFFTKLLDMIGCHLSSQQQERFAQRHRRLLQATHAHVALSFATGCVVCGIVLYTKPPADVMDSAPEAEAAKDAMRYQLHTQVSLKWLWLVYYHHPMYAHAGG